MKFIIILLGLLILETPICRPIYTEQNQDFVNSTPYILSVTHPRTVLPDSLGGEISHGIAGIEAIINKNGKIIDCNIRKLVVQKNNKILINFFYGMNHNYNDSDLPENVEKYKAFFISYLRKLKVIKNESEKPRLLNKYSIVIKF